MENGVNTKKEIVKKVIRILFDIIYKIVFIICVLLIAVIIFQKVTDSNKSIGGYRIFRVITGSMMPEYDIGEVVIAKEINPRNIKVGDDIVYKGTYGDYNGKIIMHNVTKIEVDENNNLIFHAKGLHTSSVEDPLIKSEQIYGIVKLKSKILTVLYKWTTNRRTSFIVMVILAINVFISFATTKRSNKIQQLDETIDDENYEDDNEYEEDEDYEEELEEEENQIDEEDEEDE